MPQAYAAAGAASREERPPHLDKLAQEVIAPIEGGMIVGLGTGRTSSRVVRALAARVQAEHLSIRCVCTSMATEQLARELGLTVVQFGDVEEVDYLFDGAEEVDGQLRMMKGQHGAITRQRLVAQVARRCVYMAGEDKLVDQLGKRALLAVVIIPFGVASTRARLRNLGLSGVLRRNLDGEVVVTDGGGVVLDASITGRDVEQLAADLDRQPGVVDHGLFLTEADELLLEADDGSVRRICGE